MKYRLALFITALTIMILAAGLIFSGQEKSEPVSKSNNVSYNSDKK
jgi:hypothetical protein